MRRFLVRLLALVLLVVVLPLSAFAQRTGGSFGGRSWGSGRSSSSSSSGRSSSGTSWGSSRSTGGSYGGSYGGGSYTYGGGTVHSNASGGEIVCVLGCVLVFFVILFLLGSVLGKNKNVGNIQYAPPPMDPNDTFSLGALAIAFDSTAARRCRASSTGSPRRSNCRTRPTRSTARRRRWPSASRASSTPPT